jgi:hypothetical protein
MQPDGSRRLIAFNFSEEPSGGLLHFFEYDDQFRLLHKTTRLLPVRLHAPFGDITTSIVCMQLLFLQPFLQAYPV